MRPWTICSLAALGAAFLFAQSTHAGPGRDDPKSVEIENGVQPWMHVGNQIRRSSVEGYQLSYHLLSREERMAAEKGSSDTATTWLGPGNEKSHHLMVFVMDPDGTMVTDTEVAFTVKGPNGVEQKPRVMLMMGGFGVNVDLSTKGTYEIRTQIAADDKDIVDEFKYEVK